MQASSLEHLEWIGDPRVSVALLCLLSSVLLAQLIHASFLQKPTDSAEVRRKLHRLRSNPSNRPSNIDYQEKWVPNSRGVLIYRQLFIPRGPFKAVIGLFHGFGDHSSSQSSIVTKLLDKGYAVVAMDHEGHGQSDGLHVHVTDLKLLAQDAADVVLDEMRHQAAFVGKPLFLFGESMGGAIAFHVSTSSKLKDYLHGIILSAPMVDIAPETRPSWLTEKILEQVSRLFPTLAITPLPDIAANAFKNQALLETIRNDPLSYRLKVRLGSALAMKNAVEELSQSMHHLSCPVLILHGEDDRVTCPKQSARLYNECSSSDKTLKLYPDAWHSLIRGEYEETSNRVLRDCTEWMEARCGSPVAAKKANGSRSEKPTATPAECASPKSTSKSPVGSTPRGRSSTPKRNRKESN